MFLSLGKSSVPSSRERAGLGLRRPPQPSQSQLWASGGRCLSKCHGERPQLCLSPCSQTRCLHENQAAVSTQSRHLRRPASLLAPQLRRAAGTAAGKQRLAEQLPMDFNLSWACCVLLWFGNHVESNDPSWSSGMCQNSVPAYARWSK